MLYHAVPCCAIAWLVLHPAKKPICNVVRTAHNCLTCGIQEVQIAAVDAGSSQGIQQQQQQEACRRLVVFVVSCTVLKRTTACALIAAWVAGNSPASVPICQWFQQGTHSMLNAVALSTKSSRPPIDSQESDESHPELCLVECIKAPSQGGLARVWH
jgi:hypothetical protein